MNASGEKKDFLVIFTGRVFQILLAVASIRIATKFLPPEEMGGVYLFTTIYTFFVLFLISPFGQYVNRKVHSWAEIGVLNNRMNIYIGYLFGISLLSLLVGYGASLDETLGFTSHAFSVLLFLFVFFLTLNQTFLPLLNMLNSRISFVVLSVLTSLGVIVFGGVFIIAFGASAQSWLLGTVLANAIFAVCGFFFLRAQTIKKKTNVLLPSFSSIKNAVAPVLIFAAPLSVANLFMWVHGSGYRFVIEKVVGLEFLGFLGIGLAVSSQVSSSVESIVMQYLHPSFYRSINGASSEERVLYSQRLINSVLPIYFLLAIFLTFNAKYIVGILVDESYFEVYIYTAIGVWVEFFRMATNLYANIAQSEMNTRSLVIPYSLGGGAAIFLVFAASNTPNYEFYIPVALVGSALITFASMVLYMKKLMKLKFNYTGLLRSLLISTPYCLLLLADIKQGSVLSFLLVAMCGLYYVFSSYLLFSEEQ